MKWLICCILAIFVFGCESQSYVDPYITMMDSYSNELSNWDYETGEYPEEPGEPAFLPCGHRPPFWGTYRTQRGYGYTPVRCNEINHDRKMAYKAALSEYESVTSRLYTE